MIMKNQKYDELFEQFKSVFEKEGENAAFSYLDDCIAKNPNCAEVYLIRGEVYSQIDFQQAIDCFEKAIGIDPNMSQSYFARGLLYANSGDNNKAFADFSKAIELDENFVEAYSNRANMYLKLREFQQAVSDCTKAIELMSGDGEKSCEPYYNRGIAYANMGEAEKALDDYIKVIELAPENAEAYAKCGLLCSGLGREQEAICNYEKFLELDPNNTKAELVRNALRDLRNGNATSTNSSTSSGGCYVATCVYGSYDCPEVWTLRHFRDNELSSLWLGRCFIRVYYAVSPKIVELLGNKKWFSKLWKPIIDKIVCKLQNRGIDKKEIAP
jgi:tetratricopeptide (TPR) repeat protein